MPRTDLAKTAIIAVVLLLNLRSPTMAKLSVWMIRVHFLALST